MRFKTSIIMGVALAALSVPAAAAIVPGATVTDSSGATVGTIVKVSGELLVLKTDKHEVSLPVASFTATDSGALFGMTQAQLNAEIEKSLAAANEQIVVGATVKGAGGSVAGTIDAVDAEFVTLKLGSGALVKLPRNSVGAGPDGLVTSLTAAELEAAAKGPAA